jgi:NADPH-ferrihemoprotein reductase
MIGPGTGVAPFRGFLQRRAAARAAAGAAGGAFGDAWLFFGCRGAEEDFLYRHELEGWAADGTLTRLVTAFSRPPGGGAKVYVQQRLAEHGAALAALIAPPSAAVVYVCGDGAGMAKGVHAALLGACVLLRLLRLLRTPSDS